MNKEIINKVLKLMDLKEYIDIKRKEEKLEKPLAEHWFYLKLNKQYSLDQINQALTSKEEETEYSLNRYEEKRDDLFKKHKIDKTPIKVQLKDQDKLVKMLRGEA